MTGKGAVDVLVVGAGPTGLTLAAQLRAFGTRFRIIDRAAGPVHESRALAVQPRTLEVLAGLGLADSLVDRGNPAVQLQVHHGRRTTRVPLFDRGLDDTAFPFLLFVSQAETEAVLVEHLAGGDVRVERETELTDLAAAPDHVACTVRHRDGRSETVTARFVVGCDGAHSAVRRGAGIDFVGDTYPQTFLLADLDADGLEPGAAHVHLSAAGMLFFFPLGRPAPWRLLAVRPRHGEAPRGDHPPERAELQGLADAYTDGAVGLHDPVWSTCFRIHHRHAARYRADRVFVAGDAAHVHSPAGAQGMNTGIQDAWNLGWKLALVTAGTAAPDLLDTYQDERQPVGRQVLRLTDRASTFATSTNPVVGAVRALVAPRLIGLVARSARLRAAGLRSVAQLGIAYRSSPAVTDGVPRLRSGPRAGDRLPDAPITVEGRPTTLHRSLPPDRFHLLVLEPDPAPTATVWPAPALVATHRIRRRPEAGIWHDPSGEAHARLGAPRPGDTAHLLVRPDGHIAHCAAGHDPEGVRAHIRRWLPHVH